MIYMGCQFSYNLELLGWVWKQLFALFYNQKLESQLYELAL